MGSGVSVAVSVGAAVMLGEASKASAVGVVGTDVGVDKMGAGVGDICTGCAVGEGGTGDGVGPHPAMAKVKIVTITISEVRLLTARLRSRVKRCHMLLVCCYQGLDETAKATNASSAEILQLS